MAFGLALLGGTLAQSSPGLPTSIIAGSCSQPGAVAAPLANAGVPAAPNSTPAAAGLSPASAAVIPVQTSVTTVPIKLAALLDGAHAISVGQSTSKSTAVAACGNLGAGNGSADVIVGLAGGKGSRYSGIAWLHATGDQTQVTVFVDQSASGAGESDAG